MDSTPEATNHSLLAQRGKCCTISPGSCWSSKKKPLSAEDPPIVHAVPISGFLFFIPFTSGEAVHDKLEKRKKKKKIYLCFTQVSPSAFFVRADTVSLNLKQKKQSLQVNCKCVIWVSISSSLHADHVAL